MRIRIVSGAYGWHDGRRVRTMTARSGAFEVEDAEARELIESGIAVAESGELRAESGELKAESGNDAEFLTPDPEQDSTVDYRQMDAAQLRALCDERGIPYKKNAGVKALAALLEADDDVPLPELLAADPVL